MDIVAYAPAKVNMALDIVGRRGVGYHEMCMLNHSTGLQDVLTFSRADEIILTCSDPAVPVGENNLVYKAALALKQVGNVKTGAAIHIEKHIPMQAGLAGGSADCAAALRGLNRLWQLDLPMTTLQTIGGKLGADVPYCLVNGTALVTGFGDGIKPLPPLPAFPILILKPDVDISTPLGFKMTDEWRNLLHPKVLEAAEKISENHWQDALTHLGNSFEMPIFDQWPEILKIKNEMIKTGAFYTTMSGSGSTLVSYYEDQSVAENACRILKEKGYRVFLTRIQENKMQ